MATTFTYTRKKGPRSPQKPQGAHKATPTRPKGSKAASRQPGRSSGASKTPAKPQVAGHMTPRQCAGKVSHLLYKAADLVDLLPEEGPGEELASLVAVLEVGLANWLRENIPRKAALELVPELDKWGELTDVEKRLIAKVNAQ